MKLYLITDKNNLTYLEKWKEEKEITLEYNTSLVLLKLRVEIKDILNTMRDNKIRGRFLKCFVSGEVIEALTGIDPHKFSIKSYSNLSPKDLVFNNILNDLYKNRIDFSNKRFYDYLAMINLNTEYRSDTIFFLNNKLKNQKLLIPYHSVIPSLLDCFVASIKAINIQELESGDITLKGREMVNRDFFLLVVAEFLIRAERYYTKEEKIEFLKRNFNFKVGDNIERENFKNKK